MSVDAAFQQLRRANPEPDPTALRRQLQDKSTLTSKIARRSDIMDTRTPTIEKPPNLKPSRRWAPAFVAGLVVLLIGVPSFLTRNSGGVFGLFRQTPVGIAEAYMEARNAYDAEAARSLLAEDVVMRDQPMIRDLNELSAGFEVNRLLEFQFSPYECVESTRTPTQVICTYLMDSKNSHVVGYPPVNGSFVFTVSDGLIVALTHNFNFTEYGLNVFEKFAAWLDAEHPGAFDQIYREENGKNTARLTPEAIQLLDTYLTEYDESVNG